MCPFPGVSECIQSLQEVHDLDVVPATTDVPFLALDNKERAQVDEGSVLDGALWMGFNEACVQLHLQEFKQSNKKKFRKHAYGNQKTKQSITYVC